MKIEILHPTKLTLSLDDIKKIVIAESTSGMLRRTPGDRFKKNDIEYEFVKSHILPLDKPKFETSEELNAKIDEISNLEKIELTDDNKFGDPKNTAAFLIVLKEIETGKLIGVLKYRSTVRRDALWTQSDFFKETGYESSSKEGKISVSQKEALKLKPADLVGDENFRDIATLKSHCLEKAAVYVANKQLPEICLTHLEKIFESVVAGGSCPPLIGGAPFAKVYQDYLSEILAPMSVVTNWICSGDRAESEKTLLGEGGYANMLVGFNMSKNEKLTDSTMKKSETQIVKISSKGATGAPTSITAVENILKNLESRNKEQYDEFKEKFPLVFKLITDSLVTKTDRYPIEVAYNYPLLEGNKTILKKDDYDVMQKILADKTMDLDTFKKSIELTPELLRITELYKNTTPYKIQNPGPNYKPGFHVIAAVAKEVASVLNKKPEFNLGMKRLLSLSNFIQVNSRVEIVGEKKEDCKFVGFTVKYPPVFTGTIYADVSGDYDASSMRGKMSFKFK